MRRILVGGPMVTGSSKDSERNNNKNEEEQEKELTKIDELVKGAIDRPFASLITPVLYPPTKKNSLPSRKSKDSVNKRKKNSSGLKLDDDDDEDNDDESESDLSRNDNDDDYDDDDDVIMKMMTEPTMTMARNGERFILLPSNDCVTVRSYETGKSVAVLIPRIPADDIMDNNDVDDDDDDDEKDSKTTKKNKDEKNKQQSKKEKKKTQQIRSKYPFITSVCLAKFSSKQSGRSDIFSNKNNNKSAAPNPNTTSTGKNQDDDHILLVGCTDGSLREFCLQHLLCPSMMQQGYFSISNGVQVEGPVLAPRRVFGNVCSGGGIDNNSDVDAGDGTFKDVLEHLTCPSDIDATILDGNLVCYGIAERERQDVGNKLHIKTQKNSKADETKDNLDDAMEVDPTPKLSSSATTNTHIIRITLLPCRRLSNYSLVEPEKLTIDQVQIIGDYIGEYMKQDLEDDDTTTDIGTADIIDNIDQIIKRHACFPNFSRMHKPNEWYNGTVENTPRSRISKIKVHSIVSVAVESSKFPGDSNIFVLVVAPGILAIYLDRLNRNFSKSLSSTSQPGYNLGLEEEEEESGKIKKKANKEIGNVGDETSEQQIEDESNKIRYPPVVIPQRNPLQFYSSVCVSPKGCDVAIGQIKGMIQIFHYLLPLVEEYHIEMTRWKAQILSLFSAQENETSESFSPQLDLASSMPKHPVFSSIKRMLHWHQHPVLTLHYDVNSGSGDNSLLLSGGEESVLVVWQLGRGLNRPADTIPRLALGAIMHVCTSTGGSSSYGGNSSGGILVYTADNTLQLIDANNYFRLKWKVKGLHLTRTTHQIIKSSPQITLRPGPQGQPMLAIIGLPYALGQIYFYDPSEKEVTTLLEVAPFNRVSKALREGSSLPAPTITHAVWSESGDTLITVDVVPTENIFVGKHLNKTNVGVVTTVRFWCSQKEGNHKYTMEAAMSSPHGPKNRVSAVCISSDGKYACTASNDENAFRLWERIQDDTIETSGVNQDGWTCKFKIPTPSGYSEAPVRKDAMSFSPDASILAIAYGDSITLWDHHKMQLITTVRHSNDKESFVSTMKFVSSRKIADLLFTASENVVSLQSPFGWQGPSTLGWTISLPPGHKNLRVSHANYFAALEVVVIAIYNAEVDESEVVFVNPVTGTVDEKRQSVSNISGKVLSIAPSTECKALYSGWSNQSPNSASGQWLYVLTDQGQMTMLDSSVSDESIPFQSQLFPPEEGINYSIPKIPLLAEAQARSLIKLSRPVFDVSVLASSKNQQMDPLQCALGGSDNLDALFVSGDIPQIDHNFINGFFARQAGH